MFVQSASGGRLQIVPIRCQHFVKRIGGGENHFGDQARVLLGEFRREHVFQVVRQFAQFAIAAGRGITFQRVHCPANMAKLFYVAGMPFERETCFVHALENFLGTLEEKVAQLGGLFVGRKTHCAPSIR